MLRSRGIEGQNSQGKPPRAYFKVSLRSSRKLPLSKEKIRFLPEKKNQDLNMFANKSYYEGQ